MSREFGDDRATEIGRFSSSPFISGDTFRSLASIIVELDQVIYREHLRTNIVFCQMDEPSIQKLLTVSSESSRFASWKSGATLLLHNGDKFPSDEVLMALSQHFEAIYSVNAHSRSKKISSLPIGLENARLNRNGRLQYFLDELENPTPAGQRAQIVFSNFHVETNPLVRNHVAQVLADSRHGHHALFLKSGEYRNLIRQTKFVISPPGNGPDCHRTWESIYLGAVPVVLKDSIDPQFAKNLPMMAVDNYEEFCELSETELDDLYVHLTRRNRDLAFAPYWFGRLLPKHF